MNSEQLLEEIRGEMSTELDRLDSEKNLVAATGDRVDSEPVLRAAAQSELRAGTTFRQWAEAEANIRVAELCEEVAELEDEHYRRVVALLDSAPREADPGSLHEFLRSLDDTVGRVAAGLVGRGLVSDASLMQTLSYFLGTAAREETDLFRELRGENRTLLERGLATLDEICDSESDWERARATATTAINRAYNDYAESLKSMDINPKPVC